MDKRSPSQIHLPSRCKHLTAKYTLFVLNFLITVAGICLIIIGIVDIKKEPSLASLHDMTIKPAVFLLCMGCVMMVMGCLGCMGPLREHLVLLKIFSASVIIVFLVSVVGGIVTFVYLGRVKVNMREFIVRSISHFQDDSHLQEAIDYIQTRFSCCGATDYTDWEYNAYFNCSSPAQSSCGVPTSCCKIRGNMWCGFHTRGHGEMYAAHTINTHGCVPHLLRTYRNHLLVVGGIGLSVEIIEFCGLLMAGFLMKNIKLLLKEQENSTFSCSSGDVSQLPLENGTVHKSKEFCEESCLNGLEMKRFYTDEFLDEHQPDVILANCNNIAHTDFYPP